MAKHAAGIKIKGKSLVAVGIATALVTPGMFASAFAADTSQPLFQDWVLSVSEIEARSAQAQELNTGEIIDGERVFTLYPSGSYELGTVKVSLSEENVSRLESAGYRLEGFIGYADDFTVVTSSVDQRSNLVSSAFPVSQDWFSQLDTGEKAVNPFVVEGGLQYVGGSLGNWQAPEDGRNYVAQGRFDATATEASFYAGKSLSPSAESLDDWRQFSGVVVLDDAGSDLQSEHLDALRPLGHANETVTTESLGFWITALSGSEEAEGTWAGPVQTSLTGGIWLSIDSSEYTPLPADFEGGYELRDRTNGEVEAVPGSNYRYITSVSTYERDLVGGRTEVVQETLTTTLGTSFGGGLPEEWTGQLVEGSGWLSETVRDTVLLEITGDDESGYIARLGANVDSAVTVLADFDGTLSVTVDAESVRAGDWYGGSVEVGDVLGGGDGAGVLVTESQPGLSGGWVLELDPITDAVAFQVEQGLGGANQSLAGVQNRVEHLVSDTSFRYNVWVEEGTDVPPVIEPPVIEPPVIEPPVIEPPIDPEPPVVTPEPPVDPEPPVVTPPTTPEVPVIDPPVVETPRTDPPRKSTPVVTPPTEEQTPEDPTSVPPFKAETGLEDDELVTDRTLWFVGAGGLLLLGSSAYLLRRNVAAK